mmetsp:Transcript_89081/g.237725  ORF Transcript_89081/g.237725 Transcript_89081/m.237725 type:complete len:102 (-) Transcript_89081:618-923(-)
MEWEPTEPGCTRDIRLNRYECTDCLRLPRRRRQRDRREQATILQMDVCLCFDQDRYDFGVSPFRSQVNRSTPVCILLVQVLSALRDKKSQLFNVRPASSDH